MIISKHALEQYLFKQCGIVEDITHIKEKTKNKATKAIEKKVSEGVEIELKPKEAVIRLLNNGVKPATYIYSKGMLFVIVDDCVVTCYPFPKERIGRVVKSKL